MMPLKLYRYFFSIVLLGLTSVLTTASAENNDIDSCKIRKEVREQYFKELYINYYKTYSNTIAESHKVRKKIASEFIEYLETIPDTIINDHVSHFNSEILKGLKVSKNQLKFLKDEKDNFKDRASPFYKIKSFIDDCKKNKIGYNENDYEESISNLYDCIEADVKTKIEEYKVVNNEDPNEKEEEEEDEGGDGDSDSFFKDTLMILIYSLLFGVLIFLLFRKLLGFNLFRKKDSEQQSSFLEALLFIRRSLDFTFSGKKENEQQGSKNLQPKNMGEEKNSSDNKDIYFDKENANYETTATPNNDKSNISENSIEQKPVEEENNKGEGKIVTQQIIWEGDDVTVKPNSDDKSLDAFKDKISNESSSNRKELTDNSYETETLFFPDPSSERTFLILDGETEPSPRSLYKITQQPNKNTGKLEFLSNTDYQFVFNNLERFIYPVCEQKNPYIHNTTMNIKQISHGIVEIQDNKWHVTEKVLIEFY